MKEISNFGGILLLVAIVSYSNAFIVPEEVPSILSLVYSNIPPIKKGTDSRLGFGFRLGEHADFQIQLELGPQTNTRPIGTSSGSSSKRNVSPDEYNKLKQNVGSSGGTWLENWSKQTKQKQTFNKERSKDAITMAKPMITETAFKQLQQLYGKQEEPEYIGTLPGSELDSRIAQLYQLAKEENKLKINQNANNQQSVSGLSKKEQDKITADLSDVSFD